jgi:hypothetical protein
MGARAETGRQRVSHPASCPTSSQEPIGLDTGQFFLGNRQGPAVSSTWQ